MRLILTLLFTLIATSGSSQTPPDSIRYTIDSVGISYVTIPKTEFDRMLDNFRLLLDSEANKTQDILLLHREVELLKFMKKNDSLKIDIQSTQIQSLEREIELFNKQLIKALDHPWYERKELYYILGVITVLAAKG